MRTLLRNLEFVLTVDANDRLLRGASVLIDGDRIVHVGADPGGTHDRAIDASRFGMVPGFIDAHVHLGETLSRALFPDTIPTMEWVFDWAKPFYAHQTPEDERISALVSMAEMLRAGTTCFLDMGAHHDVDGVVREIERIGIRAITGRHACDVRPPGGHSGWTEEMLAHHYFANTDAALAALEQTVRTHHGAANGRIRAWVNIEGKEPASSLALHVRSRALAQKLGVGTTYHLATSEAEVRMSVERHGVSPVKRVANAGGLGPNLVIAHCVGVTDEDIELMARAGTGVAFCPATALKLGKGATRDGRYPEMLAAGVKLGIGTDGVSAGGNLSLMRQMYLMAGLFKDARADPALVGAKRALRIATIEGARLLGWDDAIGSIEPGKKADFVLFDLEHPEWVPYGDPTQGVVYSASPASIAATWVDGIAVYRDGRVQTIDESNLHRAAREHARAIARRFQPPGDTL